MTQQEYISHVNQAKKASYEYYVLSTPSLTDAAFDALLSQVEECEQQYPEWTLPDSPTQQVGSDLSDNGRRTIAHRTPKTAITTCTRIEIKVGKTGRRTPVAHFDPVTVMGRQLCRASLCSETTAAKLGIIEGSTIEVGLVHDVTPKVFRVIPDAKNHCSEESGVDSTLPAFEPETTTVAQVEEEVTSFVIPNMIPEEPTSQETENDAATTSPAPTFSGEEDTEEPEQNGMAGKLIITALSILAIVLLFPVALALAAFGIPVLNGSLMDA